MWLEKERRRKRSHPVNVTLHRYTDTARDLILRTTCTHCPGHSEIDAAMKISKYQEGPVKVGLDPSAALNASADSWKGWQASARREKIPAGHSRFMVASFVVGEKPNDWSRLLRFDLVGVGESANP
jgi:hypothetical protein